MYSYSRTETLHQKPASRLQHKCGRHDTMAQSQHPINGINSRNIYKFNAALHPDAFYSFEITPPTCRYLRSAYASPNSLLSTPGIISTTSATTII